MYQTNEYIDFLNHGLVSDFYPEQHVRPDNALQFLGKQCRRKYQAESQRQCQSRLPASILNVQFYFLYAI